MKAQLAVIVLLTAGTVLAQPGNGGPPPSSSGADFVTRLDQDGDGKVSQSEFDGPDEHFEQLDKNSDGFISSDEAPTGPPPGGGGGTHLY